MSWIVDNANLVYIVLGIILLGLGVSWWLHRRVKTLVIAGGVIALIGLFWLLTWLIPTDRKQIEANLWEMALAAREGKADGVAKHLAKSFRYGGMNRDEVARAAAASAKNFKVESVNLWEFDVKSLTDDK